MAALAVADLHLWHKAPSCRAEKDWLQVQQGYLHQLKDVHEEYGRPPLLLGGDVFDRWNAYPEVVTLALDCLPDCYGVPGNHDLPHHSADLIDRSAYWTLVRAGRVKSLNPRRPVGAGGVVITGFPFGEEVRSYTGNNIPLSIALIHDYVWTKGCSYPGAPEGKHFTCHKKGLEGYCVALFGDNHIPFEASPRLGCLLVNCGTFIRRRRDEIGIRPSVVLIYLDGSIQRRYLDTSGDVFTEPPTAASVGDLEGVDDFITSLEGLGQSSIDFGVAIRRVLDAGEFNDQVRRLVMQALEDRLR